MSDVIGAFGPHDDFVGAFWQRARRRMGRDRLPGYLATSVEEAMPPPAWSFGATPEQADELLALVLDGVKTATATALWDYEEAGEPLPAVGDLGIALDGRGMPRALLETTDVEVRPFDDVDAEHARLEGEGDRTLAYWRRVHEEFFTENAAHRRGFSADMPVVLERFVVRYAG